MDKKVLTLHMPPDVIRAYFKSWKDRAEADKKMTPAQLAIISDALQLIDVAISTLEPLPAEPGNDNTKK